MTTTNTTRRGQNLRAAREGAGLTRAQLAGLAGCSLAQLGNIESGAVPQTSRVLDAAFAAIEAFTTSEAAPAGGSAKTRQAGRTRAAR